MAISSEIEKLERRWQQSSGLVFAPLAEAYRKAGLHPRALEILEQGLALHAEYGPALIVRARCHLDMGDLGAAEEAFNQALVRDTLDPIALRGLADVCERSGRLPEAIERLRSLIDVDPRNSEARVVLERLLATPAPSAVQEPPPAAPESVQTHVEPARDQRGSLDSLDFDVVNLSAVESLPALPEVRESGPMDEDFTVQTFAAEPLEVPVVAEAPAPVMWTPAPVGVPVVPPPVATLETVEAVASIETIETIETMETMETIETMEMVEAANADVTAEKVDAIEPIETVEATHLADVARMADAPLQIEAAQPVAAVEAVEFVESVAAADAMDLVEMSEPVVAPNAVVEVVVAVADAVAAPMEDAFDEFEMVDEGEAVDAYDEFEELAIAEPVAMAEPLVEEPTVEEYGYGVDVSPEVDAMVPEAPPADVPAEPVPEFADESAPELAPESTRSPVLIVTESMAELFLKQGHRELALAVYRQLLEREPGADHLRGAIARLEQELAPAASPSLRATRTFAAAETGGRSVERRLQAVLHAPPPSSASTVLPPAIEPGAEPTRASGDALSLAAVFGDEPGQARREAEPAPASSEPSYDEFFGAGPAEPTAAPSPRGEAEDLRQFNDWLKGLKR